MEYFGVLECWELNTSQFGGVVASSHLLWFGEKLHKPALADPQDER
jgi:hypothetical protein